MPNLRLSVRIASFVACLASFAGLPEHLLAQGETTSAVAGTVVDPSGAAIADATVTVNSTETGLKRSVKTDGAGRFNFPQLKPGPYFVGVAADGFVPQVNASVASGLGQKQTITFVLKLTVTKGAVTVTGEAPLVNPENPTRPPR